MKTIKLLVAGLLTVVSSCALSANLYTNEVGGVKWVYTISDGKATLGGGSSSLRAIVGTVPEKVEVPSSLGGTPVVSIASYAFSGFGNITNLFVPTCVQSIGYGAFGGCASLESLTVPFVGMQRGNDLSSNALIGYMFGDGYSTGARRVRQYYYSRYSYEYYYYIPTNLASVVVTDESKIGYGAFYGCEDLKSVTVGEGVTTIGTSAFYGCSRLEDVEIPDSMVSIDGTAFSGCTSLMYDTASISGLKLLDGWVSGYTAELTGKLDLTNVRGIIAGDIFRNCAGITELVVPGTMSAIPQSSFQGCTNLVKVTLAEGVKSIGGYAFYGCSKLREISIPASLTYSGIGAFYYCTSLQNVNIVDLGAWCGIEFGDFDSNPTRYAHSLTLDGEILHDIVIPEEIKKLYPKVFTDNFALTSVVVPNGVPYIPVDAFIGCRGITNMVLPESIADIGEAAFQDCANLTVMAIPAAVTNISRHAFFGYNSSMRLEELALHEGLVSIGSGAFCNCPNLTAITIPSSVESIGSDAFSGCRDLEVTIAEGAGRIVDGAFANCAGLKAVVFPSSLTNIGDRAFYNCSGLTELNLPDSVCVIGNSAFSGATKLRGIKLPSELERIGSSAFYSCGKITDVVMPQTVREIGEQAFYNCSAITNLSISAAITNISSYAFYGCTSLEVIDIPEGVCQLSSYAFSNCSNLKSAKIPSTVTLIDSYAFNNCSKLTKVFIDDLSAWCRIKFVKNSVDPGHDFANPIDCAKAVLVLNGREVKDLAIPEDIFEIKNHAFYNCTNLTSVTMHNGVTNVGKSAFYNCSGITNIVLSSGLKNIANYAFEDCRSFSSLHLPASVETIGDYAFRNCANLVSVSLDGEIVSVGQDFLSGTAIESIEIAPGIEGICDNMFKNCVGLKHVTIPSSVKTIGAHAFDRCTSIESLELPSSLERIGPYAFYDVDFFTDLILPEPLESIGEYAFYRCLNLTNLTVSGSVSLIGQYAFAACSNLTATVFSKTYTPAGDQAPLRFNSNQWILTADMSLQSAAISHNSSTIVDFSAELSEPGELVFDWKVSSEGSYDFLSLYVDGTRIDRISGAPGWTTKTVALEAGVHTIRWTYSKDGSNAYYSDCGWIRNVTVAGVNVSYYNQHFYVGASAFEGCVALKKVRATSLSSWCMSSFANPAANPIFYAGALEVDGSVVEDIQIPGDVPTVETYAFVGDERIRSVAACANLRRIEKGAFQGCDGIQVIDIPSTVSYINADAFYMCSAIGRASLPVDRSPVRTLLYPAYMTSLMEVDIADGTTYITSLGLANCSKLESVVIPESVKMIRSRAFYACMSLPTVEIPSSVEMVYPDAFVNCTKLDAILVDEANTNLFSREGVLFSHSVMTNGEEMTTVLCCPAMRTGLYSIDDDVDTLGTYAFNGCAKLTEIFIPSKISSFPLTAFRGAVSLSAVRVSEDNQYFKDIDGVVFSKDGKTLIYYPEGRKGDYEIPEGVETIGQSAFYNCKGLTGIRIPGSVREIVSYAFQDCSNITWAELSYGVETIGNYAFDGCALLTSVDVPDSVGALGANVFRGCTSLVNLNIPAHVAITPTTLSGTISTTNTLALGNIYHVTGNLVVNNGGCLNLPAGTVLKLASFVSITVNSGGALNALGTRASPVIITSITDDTIGGDSNGDGSATTPAAGFWDEITNYGTLNLTYAKVRYGGYGQWSNRGDATIRSYGGTTTLNGCTVECSDLMLLNCAGGKMDVYNSVLRDGRWGISGGNARFINGVIADCNTGASGGTVINTIFYGCQTAASGTTVKNSIAFECDSGTGGMMLANPLFDLNKGDWSVEKWSPCVDAGDGTVAPKTDYFGQTRQNIYENATGTPDMNGNIPDIGIFEVLSKPITNDVDLAVVGIESPEVFVVGQRVTVSWTVKNLGSRPVSGTWADIVELICSNGSIVNLGTLPISATFPAGSARTFFGTFTVPSAQVGNVKVRVTTNANRDIFEGTLTANNSAESEVAKLTMPELAFPESGVASFSVTAGRSVGYRLGDGFAEGGLLIVHAESAKAGGVKVWTGNGQIPTADIFYAAAVEVGGGDYLVRVPAGGDAYVAFANEGSGIAKVEVGTEAGAFLLFDTGVVTAPNAGTASLTLFGNGFDDGMEAWIEKGGMRVGASEVVIFDPVKAVATFDVTGLAAGAYEVHVKKGDAEAAVTLLSLTETRIGPKWSCKLDIASSVRSSREYVGYLEYANTGDMPLDAPYVKITSGSGSFIRFGTADAWGDTLELMAVSETYPASQLKPGETRRIPFRYKTTGSSLSVECGYTQQDAGAFPWDTNAAYMRPSWASDELWGLSLAVLKSNVGATWNDYLARMRANCDHLAKIGQPTYRLDRIWQLEINEALGVDHAVSTLASNTDLARSGRGFGLALSRSYGSGLYRRLRKGIFGYGWSDNYSAYAELQNSGATLALHSGSGSTYLFEKVNGKWTPEDARDKTTCTETSTEYILKYRSGTEQRIAKSSMRVTSVKENQGNALTFTYNADKQLVKVEHCDGQSLSFTYANGLLVSAAEDQGRTTTYEYSGDMLVKVTAFNGLSTQYRYLAADGSVTSRALRQVVYADGTTRDYTYDGAGHVATVAINGNLQMVEIVRGALGSYSVIAPNGGETTVLLGASGEVLETINALGQKSTRIYTADTLLEAVVGPTGKRAKIGYDEDGQAVKATDAAGADTHFAYTPDFGNLAKVTDARGNAFDYGYDKLGRSKSISYADGSIESIAYNDRGGVTNSVNRRGQSIAFTYDNEGNTLSKVWDDGRTFTWAYDAKGNCTNATDSATGIVTMEYDENERLTRIVHPKGRGFAYEYDSLGRTISRTTLGGTGSVPSAADIQRYSYDSLGRLSRMTDGDGNLYVENSYDPVTGWLVTQTYGNGTIVSNAYDILGRTIGIYHGRAVSMKPPYLAFFEYEYDAEGRRISQTTAEGVERYTYDTVGQLTDVYYPDGTEEHFSYDAVGNRITHTGTTGVSPVEETYTANNLNQYTILRDSASLREENLTYDLDGNMTRKGDTCYYYDIQNRLVAVTNTTTDIAWSCEYDVFGNRTKVIDHGTAKETLFVQGSLASAVADYDSSGSPTARHILLGSVRLADITTPNSPTPNSQTLYYHADGLASTRLLTDANGDTIGTASYRAFGDVRASSGDTTSAGWVGTLGVERDDATGLIFMRNRYYDAGQGRFIQMDPIGIEANDLNLYRYCFNQCVYSYDPSGLAGEAAVLTLTCKKGAAKLVPGLGTAMSVYDIGHALVLTGELGLLYYESYQLDQQLSKVQPVTPVVNVNAKANTDTTRGNDNDPCKRMNRYLDNHPGEQLGPKDQELWEKYKCKREPGKYSPNQR